MIIAVDGPAAAGKGTLARALARHFDFAHLDTGMLYRAVAAKLLAEGGDPQDPGAAARVAHDLVAADLERDDLRGDAVANAASLVAAQPAVRAALLAFQRRFAEHPPGGKTGAVLDGRDIGTVVCPDATVKFFVTASLEARARRRHKELIERGEESIYARVLADMQARDDRDSGRSTAPLAAAADALRIDTSELDAEAVLKAALAAIAAHPNTAGTGQR
jgi:cytidylate kinase